MNKEWTCKLSNMCYNYKDMRKTITISVICLLLIISSAGYSWSRGYYYGCGGCNNGWAVGAAIAGGILVGAVVTNMIVQSTAYNPPPQRVYVYPQPNVVYAYPQPSNVVYAYPQQSNAAYAYPDPEFVARYGKNKPSGEWAVVPGQSINGKWVPEHKVWVQ